MWNSIKEDTFRDLRASAHTNRLLITGISLGGGLAAISYVDILQSNIF
jgi:esterase/lipase